MTRRGTCWKRAGDGNKIYEYDALNRLGGIRSGAGVWKNRYDGESLRYETEENDKVTRFVFDRGELASEESGAGGIRYIHGDDRVLCSERENMGMGYHIRDEAGSTLFILDRERNIRKSYRYDAFGRVLEERGDIENRLTYTGQMYDGGTGQYYLRARFYNPVTGRFLQEDVYRGDGLNLYAYCANNPVKYYDPSGYMSLCPGGKTFPGNGDGGTDSKKVPNPNGKKGGKAHQDKINDIIEDAEGRGLRSNTEYKFNSTGGYKNSRYADVVVYDSQGRVMEIHQVGRSTKRYHAPVSREKKAIKDIRSSQNYNGAKIYYHPYD